MLKSREQIKNKANFIVYLILLIFILSITNINSIYVTGNSIATDKATTNKFTTNKITGEITGDSITTKATTQNLDLNISVSEVIPAFEPTPKDIYICENEALVRYVNISFNAAYPITTKIDPTFPQSPFYITFWETINASKETYLLYSGTISKSDIGGVNNGSYVYAENISSTDLTNVGSWLTNITAIEINNKPTIETIGVKTIFTGGANTTFYKEVQITDAEDGNQDSGNLSINITTTNSTGDRITLLNISSTGVINFTATSNDTGIYNISVCATDNGILNPHPGIQGNCSQDGSSDNSCDIFELTILTQNRQPNITSFNPTNQTQTVIGTDFIEFNITKYDPDLTTPDTYWYVDDKFKELDQGSSFDKFSYSFGCGLDGNHNVVVEITDGLLNDSVQWNFTVINVPCPKPIGRPGGGAGGGSSGRDRNRTEGISLACTEKWTCNDWSECINLNKVKIANNLDKVTIENLENNCRLNALNTNDCGFQVRNCLDLNNCNTQDNNPGILQECYFSKDPSCSDNLKNCHSGSCEIGLDCGGPCSPCFIDLPAQSAQKAFLYIFLIIFLLICALIVKLLLDYNKSHITLQDFMKYKINYYKK